MSDKIIIPTEIAQHLRNIHQVLIIKTQKMERDHDFWTCPQDPDDWSVQIDHREFLQLVNDLREIAKFAEWLAMFEVQGE